MFTLYLSPNYFRNRGPARGFRATFWNFKVSFVIVFTIIHITVGKLFDSTVSIVLTQN